MLVLALTGTDPDRLAEEKAREMTIDLGFAFLSLPGIAGAVAIVDVPGHEMFLRNMVAGATGIDAAMLVIACDEGVMPQTVEHLDVLRCLRISEGVIVLTKADKSPDLIPAVTEEARELVRGTFLEKARAIPVSSVTGEGLPALKEELARIAARVQARSAEGIFRLPIDRVFTLKGVGTVVTGTVISGSLKTGETVACLPQNSALRVRGLQVHNQPAAEVFAGQRAAINLADASKEDLERGNVLAAPGSLAPTLMADVRLELSLRGEKKPLAQRARVRIHHGTSELMARVVLLDRESLPAGESALVQLRFESPLVAAAGDPFVVRSYSPMFVIGGGSVVDPHPPKRRKAAGAEDVAKRESSPVADVILDALDRAGARGVEFARPADPLRDRRRGAPVRAGRDEERSARRRRPPRCLVQRRRAPRDAGGDHRAAGAPARGGAAAPVRRAQPGLRRRRARAGVARVLPPGARRPARPRRSGRRRRAAAPGDSPAAVGRPLRGGSRETAGAVPRERPGRADRRRMGRARRARPSRTAGARSTPWPRRAN